jgi:hypothetical protein
MMADMITLMLIGLLRGIRTQRFLALENLVLRHQLVVLQRTVLVDPHRDVFQVERAADDLGAILGRAGAPPGRGPRPTRVDPATARRGM